MIVELLRPEKIVALGPKGDLVQALEELLQHSSLQMQRAEIVAATANANRYGYIGNQIAVPHVRLENLNAPEMILGLSPHGVRLGSETVKILLFFATPANETEQHLQLLQRLTSLLPAIKDELLAQRTPSQILRTIARGEQQAGKATYINLTQEQVAFELQTDLQQGLGAEEAYRRLAHYGPNILQKARSVPWYLKLLKNFFSFFALLLWIAAALCFVPGVDMPQLGGAIFAVIFINGFFSFLQEQRADRAVEMLQSLIAHPCKIIRAGQTAEIDAASLVPGDLILVAEGDLVPADARLIEAFEVEVDNSSLTGESNPAHRYKSDHPILI
jgi:sodium/potassium-transporting ATPase subunit alpha